ncbi:MAG: Gfo/Idh/MocA family oxidoreductase [Paludibacter sp.]|nr:Gfo/Idh/MocA family oxidoreductase [Paludibacter sp.]MDD4199352.1 Gfo/Idh/MocA family oxidoreductase [Paludibacter sp.]MDD4427803.1 Gfo/Idh/MocA family oxidoreductase [Paludibacter sp.]
MKSKFYFSLIVFFLLITFIVKGEIRVGIIGLDTSHAPEFVKSLNAEISKPEYAGFKVVAAYPYGSKTIKSSYDRIPKYTEEVKKYGVKISNSIEEMLKEVDCVMLETNDGNLHLEQALLIFKAGKPVFIDKPIGANLAQAIAIYKMAEKYHVPLFSSSALRYSPDNQKLRKGEMGKVFGVDAFSPGRMEPSHADLAWYTIHGVEIMYTIMGKGCESVQRTNTEGSDFIVGKWSDGRIGTVRGIRDGMSSYGGLAITDKNVVPAGGYSGYDPLLVEIVQFFKTKVPPISKEETLEIFAFIEAADMSKEKGGKTVTIADAMKKSQKEAKGLIKKLKK